MHIRDLRYAIRQLRHSRGFTSAVVLTLALSVGLATAVFCVIDCVILRPLPYVHPERLVSVQGFSPSGYDQPASWPGFQDERAQAGAFSALAGYSGGSTNLRTPSGETVELRTTRSSDNLFQVLGVQPALGRTFRPGEEQEGRNDVVVLSFEVWRQYFGGRKDVIGQTAKLDERAYTVIGVMPAGFRFPIARRNAIYTPLHIDHQWMPRRGNHWLNTVGRLKDGVTLAQAQSDVARVFSDIGKAYPETDSGRTARLVSLQDEISGHTRGPLWTLLAAVIAVLAIGCVNVAGLLLARGVKREREMAMRVAIGAARGRLLGQVLTEGLLLAVLGAAGGVMLAELLLRLMRVFLVHALSRGAYIHMDWAVLGCAIALAVITSLAASIYPALRLSGIDPNRVLKSGGNAGADRAQHRLRSGVVILQVSLTLVLLAVAGMLMRMVINYRHTDLGFDPARIASLDINLAPARYEGRDMVDGFYTPFLNRVTQIPGVKAAGVITLLPIADWGSNSDIQIAGQPPNPPNQEMLAENRFVSEGYFDVFGIPLHRGRALSPSLDKLGDPALHMVVNEAFVRKFIPGKLDPTSQRIFEGGDPAKWPQIVGVAGNVRQDIYKPPLAERDMLMNQLPLEERSAALSSMSLVIRSDGDPMLLMPAVRAALHAVDPTVPLKAPLRMTDVVSEALAFERMETWLFGIFAGLALLLAMVGLYGLVSHEVEQSRRDIGVRMALGATRGRIFVMILRRVARMLGAGAVAGMLLALVAKKLIGVIIYFDTQKEASTLAIVFLLLAVTGLIAALIPALRAASIEPMQALRSE